MGRVSGIVSSFPSPPENNNVDTDGHDNMVRLTFFQYTQVNNKAVTHYSLT